MYLYVAADYGHLPGTSETKVGISKNPRRRVGNLQKYGLYILKKKWLMPNEQQARALETLVCNSFPKYMGREFLRTYVDDVIAFIEKHVSSYGGVNG